MSDQSLTGTVGKGTAWVSSFSFVTKVVGLATTFLILSRLRVYEFGLLKLVLSLIPLLGFIQLPGISSVVVADMGVEKGEGNKVRMKEIFTNYFKLTALLSVLAWAVLFFGAEIASSLYNEAIAFYVRIASFIFLISPVRSAYQTLFAVSFKFFERSFFSFTEEFAKFLLIAGLILFFGASIEGIIFVTVLASLVPLLIFAPSFLRSYSFLRGVKVSSKEPFWYILRKHAKWSVFSSYLSSFGTNIRMWIVQVVIGTEAVGLYALASGLVSHTSALFPLHSVLMPVIPQFLAFKKRFKRIVNKGIKYQVMGNVLLGLIAFTLFPPIISFLFPQYAPAMPLFRIMLLVLIPTAFAGMLTALFFALKGQKNLFKVEIIKTVIMLTLGPAMLLVFGLYGIAYEFVLTVIIFTYLRYREIKKLLPGFSISMRDYLQYDDEDRMVVRRAKGFLMRYLPFNV